MPNDRSEMDDRGKRFFEQAVLRLRPGSKLSWSEEAQSEVHTVRISRAGGRVKIEITEEALSQAACDPGSHKRLARAVDVQLRLCESGGRGQVRRV